MVMTMVAIGVWALQVCHQVISERLVQETTTASNTKEVL